jgi:hypothetical protein
MFLGEQFVESVESGVPDGCALCEPFLNLLQTGGASANQVQSSDAPALDESGVLEDLKVPRNRRKRNTERSREHSDAAFTTFGETLHDAAARGIGESRKNLGNLASIVNHDVKYTRTGARVKKQLT